MVNEERVLVTGGSGMVGAALKRIIPNAYFLSSTDCDLRDASATKRLFQKNKFNKVIHLAATVGGVRANTEFVADFFYNNILINTNVLHTSKELGIEKVLSLMSTCVYPNVANYPLVAKEIHEGPPHSSNFGYAYAKRMLDVQSRAYRYQYGCNFVTAIPNNLYGEYDNFDIENGHVIPTMIRKFHEGNLTGKEVTLWGDGSALREFTYSDDLARILVFLLERHNYEYPINIGNSTEVTIKHLAEKIAKIMRFNGKIIWDNSRPAGQHRKPSSNASLIDLGWESSDYVGLDLGLENTCKWFMDNYPKVRGVKV